MNQKASTGLSIRPVTTFFFSFLSKEKNHLPSSPPIVITSGAQEFVDITLNLPTYIYPAKKSRHLRHVEKTKKIVWGSKDHSNLLTGFT